jgi:hypothetical protein
MLVLGFGAVSPVSAKSLSFDSIPVTDAVAQIDKAFGANIVVKPGVDADALVSFSVGDISDPGARLEAINDLANALNADYSKVFVISRKTDEATPPDPAIDAVGAPVVFTDATVPAADAIRTVARIDDADVQFYSPLHDSVMFTATQMPAEAAAREIARQTHTVWKAYYTFTPRLRGARQSSMAGEKIIGYTAGGQPITELPVDTFRAAVNPPPPAEVKPAPPAAKTPADTAKADAAAQANQAVPYPGSPYGYGYYGYNPYAGYPGYYGGYGVTAPMMIGSGVGSSFNPYANPYGYGYGAGYSPYGYSSGGGSVVMGSSPFSMTPSFGSNIFATPW